MRHRETLSASARSRAETLNRHGSLPASQRGSVLVVGLAGFLILGASQPLVAREYRARDLTPAGSTAGRLDAAAGGRQVGSAQAGNGYPHAVLLSGNALTAVDLNPLNYWYSMAMCADDSQQGGWGSSSMGLVHALVWNGSATAYADLNPAGYGVSYCLGVHDGEQVGYAQYQSDHGLVSHAMSWHGSAASVLDLHPAGPHPFSRALGCHQGEEVGYVSTVAYPDGEGMGGHTTSRAVRWLGTAASVVSLHPRGWDASEATCTTGSQQGGWGFLAANCSQHALLWSGASNRVVDLHPRGFTDSKVNAITPTAQVGEGWIGPAAGQNSVRHALSWSGTADSVVDLNAYLPAGFTNGVATGVDADGQIVGYAYNGNASGLAIPAGAVAVVFAPGAPSSTQLATWNLNPAEATPGAVVQGQISLDGPAPVGGVQLRFLSLATNLIPTPASGWIPAGERKAIFDVVTDGSNLTMPTRVEVYATDGMVSRVATLTLTPVIKLAQLTVHGVEGGFSAHGSVELNIPAPAGGATVSLASDWGALVAMPATITVPPGATAADFTLTTPPVTAITHVPITASLNGLTVHGMATLMPAPAIALAELSAPEVVGGQTVPITIRLNNFPRSAAGVEIALTSADPGAVQLPAWVNVPAGAYSVTVNARTAVVSALTQVVVNARYDGVIQAIPLEIHPVVPLTLTPVLSSGGIDRTRGMTGRVNSVHVSVTAKPSVTANFR